jgi:hypothetical protein
LETDGARPRDEKQQAHQQRNSPQPRPFHRDADRPIMSNVPPGANSRMGRARRQIGLERRFSPTTNEEPLMKTILASILAGAFLISVPSFVQAGVTEGKDSGDKAAKKDKKADKADKGAKKDDAAKTGGGGW